MTQKPDDDLFENIVNRGYRVYGHGIDEVVRDVVALGGRPLVETLLSHGWKPWRDEDMRELKKLVVALHDHLVTQASQQRSEDQGPGAA